VGSSDDKFMNIVLVCDRQQVPPMGVIERHTRTQLSGKKLEEKSLTEIVHY